MADFLKPQLLLCSGLALTGLVSCSQKEKVQLDRPNILFFILDDASYNHFSAYGCPYVNTPGFDRVASEGVLFNSCYTPNAKSAPSRAVILTGRYSWQLGSGGNHITNFPAEYKVYTEALREAGYNVGFTGKGWAPGNPGQNSDGSQRQLTGKPYQQKTLKPATRFISKVDYSSNFKDFLDEQEIGTPWCFWAGAREPHRKYEYGSGVAKGGKSLDQIDRVPEYWPDCETVRNDILDYVYEIESADKHLVAMLDELESRGMLDNTIVVVTADNGMPFPRAKANNYEQSHHQPLAVMWHDGVRNPGRKVDDIVNFVDFAPTFLEAAGIGDDRGGMSEFSGKSFMDILRSRKAGQVCKDRDRLIVGRERDDYGRPQNQGYPIRGIMREGKLYLWNLKPELWPACNPEMGYCEIDGSPTKSMILTMARRQKDSTLFNLSMGFRPEEELYDVIADPDCMENLADQPDYEQLKQSLRDELLSVLKSQDDPRLCGDPDVFDKYPYNLEEDWLIYEKVIDGQLPEPWKMTDWINATDYDRYVYLLDSGQIEPMKEFTSGINW